MTEKPLSIRQPEGAEVDEGAVRQIVNCLAHPKAVAGALMADHHLGYAMPIGGVIAYEGAVSPTGVGFDIACGNMAVKTNVLLEDIITENGIRDAIKPIMREVQKGIEFGVGRKNATPIDHPLFDEDVWTAVDETFGPNLKVKAREQLGTVGSGNHYVDLLTDDADNIWIANHFGSRGLGHTIASGFFAAAQNLPFTERVKEGEDPVVLGTDTDLGVFYIACMYLAGQYAYAGREYVIDQVLDILGAEATFSVHNHHNFAWLENGQWVVRKGATPLTRAPAFIGGSMGDVSVIVRGEPNVLDNIAIGDNTVNGVQNIGALGSAPHGAGRQMSRTVAAGKMRKMFSCGTRDCEWTQRVEHGGERPRQCPKCGNKRIHKGRMRDPETAAINWQEVRQDLWDRGIVVLGAGADEAPGAYKDLESVLAAHSNIQVLETLRPIGVVMAGADTFDPYKD